MQSLNKIIIVLIVLMGNGLAGRESGDVAITAKEIVRKSDELRRRSASHGKITMLITRPKWHREMTLIAWTQGTKTSLVRILEPKRDKGVTFLRKGREAWQFIPAINRTIKIPPSMMFQSWLGSDFTNEDVVRSDSIIVDYDHEIINEVIIDDLPHYVIDAIPKPNAPVVWGKVVLTIRKLNYIATKIEYFDEDFVKVKELKNSKIREIDGQDTPMKSVMYDFQRKGHQTEFEFQSLTFNPKIRADLFSQRSLKRITSEVSE